MKPNSISKRSAVILACCLVIVLAGCSTSQVAYDYDTGIDFVAFKSYQWHTKPTQAKDPRISNDLLDQRIQGAINQSLQRKNYVMVSPGQNTTVDFLVAYQLGIEKRTEADRVRTGVGFGYRYFDFGFRTDTIVREFNEVTLYIDVIDPQSEKLIWRGTRAYRYQAGGSVAEREQRIQSIVDEILAKFPPIS
ncbi:MAG: DUF4136 domain-containing protein [Pseudomonadales bacterium]|nr:DUF4136 domain-containing protein [Pseudomonadales bacterium]